MKAKPPPGRLQVDKALISLLQIATTVTNLVISPEIAQNRRRIKAQAKEKVKIRDRRHKRQVTVVEALDPPRDSRIRWDELRRLYQGYTAITFITEDVDMAKSAATSTLITYHRPRKTS
jgi:hypothetical protein